MGQICAIFLNGNHDFEHIIHGILMVYIIINYSKSTWDMENNDGYSWRIPPPNLLNTSCSMVPTTGKSPGKTMLSRGVSYLMDGIVTETKRNDSNMVIY